MDKIFPFIVVEKMYNVFLHLFSCQWTGKAIHVVVKRQGYLAMHCLKNPPNFGLFLLQIHYGGS
jgi:hypothetical protein